MNLGSCSETLRGVIVGFVRPEPGMPCDSLSFMVIFKLFIMKPFQNQLSGIIVLLMQLLRPASDPMRNFS